MPEPDTGLDPLDAAALDVIQKTHWLEESTRDHQLRVSANSTFEPHLLPDYDIWKMDMDQQNLDKINNAEPDETEGTNEPSSPLMASNVENDIEISVQQSTVDNDQSIEEIAANVIEEYSLNRKQRVAFNMAIKNVVKRHKQEETEQIIGYIGGPGGTGKSQVIKAIVRFHERMNIRNTLKLTAHTGTAAKHRR